MELIKNLWRGDLPLAKTYWLFGVATSALFVVTFKIIEYNELEFRDAGLLNIVSYTVLVAYIAYSAFVSVAIWRSAAKYKGSAIWSDLARFSVVGLIGSCLQLSLSNERFNNGALVEQAAILNRSLPTMIDEITRLDYVSTEQHGFVYHHTLVKYASTQINRAQRAQFQEQMSANIRTKVCAEKSTRSLLEAGVSLDYQYYGNDGRLIVTTVVTRPDCGYP